MDKRLRIFWRTLCVGPAVVAALAAPAVASAATDPLLTDQWALSDPSMIGAKEAWTQSDGAGVVVAVLDTGVQLDHPDLAGAIWTNPNEIPNNGIDDDHDGIVDDVHGANMFTGTGDVSDDNGHGTHVAGIIAARKGNGIGGAGLAPKATIMPVKVLDSTMSGTTDTLALGIRYAVDRGAKILNVSVNTDDQTDTVASAVRYAGEHGAIVVASAGNNGRDIDLVPSYPASLPDPAIMSVAAESDDGLLWDGSNTGLNSVDLAAPGDHVVSTALGGGYQSRTGTSAAAPFVSASLALLASARPDLPMSALRDAIDTTTRHSSLLSSLLGTGGRLDVGAAMHRVLTGAAWRSGGSTDDSVSGPLLKLKTRSKARAGSKVKLTWTVADASTVAKWRISLDGRVVGSVAADRAGVTRRIARAGHHRWRVVGFDASGAKVVAAKRAFSVTRT